MRLSFLKPVNGWRGFVTELAIVVLGVLIALGTQQAVDEWQGKRNVVALREALDAELANNLDAYAGRIDQSACLATRLDQLERWQRDWRDGSGPALDGEIGRPLAYGLRFNVWRTGASTVAAYMSLKQRLDYASLYDRFESYDSLRLREVATWQGLFAYDGATRLSPQEVNTLRGLILWARSTDRSMRANFSGIKQSVIDLGIKPLPRGTDRGRLPNGLCPPLRTRA